MRENSYILHKSAVRSLLFFLILLSATSKAQDFFDDDARFWLYLKVEKKISERWEGQLNVQNRFNNNIGEFSQLNLNGEVTYKINRYVKVLGGYVWGEKRKKEGFYLSRQQVYAGFRLRHKVRRITLTYRNLVQGQTSASYDRDKARLFEYFDRNKLTVKYQLNKRLEPYVAGEINIPLASYIDPYVPGQLTINRVRLFAGLEFRLTKRSYLETYFLYQRKYFSKGYPPRDFIYGLTYGYSFL